VKLLVLTNMYPTETHPYSGIFVKEQVDSLREAGLDVATFIINARSRKEGYVAALFKLRRNLAFVNYDVVHAHHSYCLLIFAAACFPGRPKPRTVLTFHEAEVARPVEIRARDFRQFLRYSRLLKKLASRLADRILPVSDNVARCMNFRSTTEIIPCGVDLKKFFPLPRQKAREKLGLDVNRKYLFFPANPARNIHKGTALLCEALRHLKRKQTGVDLITGGAIPHGEMPLYYSASNVVVHTSAYEASPTAIKEAMACNRPIVTTDVGDVRKIIGPTKGCFISSISPQEFAENIERALVFEETDGRERIISLGLDLGRTAQKVIRVYESLSRKENLI